MDQRTKTSLRNLQYILSLEWWATHTLDRQREPSSIRDTVELSDQNPCHLLFSYKYKHFEYLFSVGVGTFKLHSVNWYWNFILLWVSKRFCFMHEDCCSVCYVCVQVVELIHSTVHWLRKIFLWAVDIHFDCWWKCHTRL